MENVGSNLINPKTITFQSFKQIKYNKNVDHNKFDNDHKISMCHVYLMNLWLSNFLLSRDINNKKFTERKKKQHEF